MSDVRRPGGLTALAVINFVFAAMSALNVLGLVAAGAVIEIPQVKEALDKDKSKMTSEERRQFEESMALLTDPDIRLFTMLDTIPAVLLLVSGVGYLRQRRVMGRWFGNGYGAVGSCLAASEFFVLGEKLGMAMGLVLILGLLYPLVTLFLLNVTFRDDFPN